MGTAVGRGIYILIWTPNYKGDYIFQSTNISSLIQVQVSIHRQKNLHTDLIRDQTQNIPVSYPETPGIPMFLYKYSSPPPSSSSLISFGHMSICPQARDEGIQLAMHNSAHGAEFHLFLLMSTRELTT
jgi:hypothetical protein